MPEEIGLSIAYSSISELISTIAAMKGKFDNMVAALKQIDGVLPDNWQGNVTKPFCDDYHACMKKLDNISNLFDKYTSAIASAADEIATADTQAGARASANLGQGGNASGGNTVLKFRTIQDGPTF